MLKHVLTELMRLVKLVYYYRKGGPTLGLRRACNYNVWHGPAQVICAVGVFEDVCSMCGSILWISQGGRLLLRTPDEPLCCWCVALLDV